MPRFNASNFQATFFDRAAVINAMDEAKRVALAKAGFLIMTTARRSMRRRKYGKHSAPGDPPFAHSGEMRDQLFFAYDPATDSVVVGPARLNGRQYRGQIPALHEFGGAVPTPPGGKKIWVLAASARGRRKVWTQIVVRGPLVYPKRPFMRPAFDKCLPRIAAMFRDKFGSGVGGGVAGAADAA